MTGRALIELTPKVLVAALRAAGLDLPPDPELVVVAARVDPFRGRDGTVQLLLAGEGLPSCGEADLPVPLSTRSLDAALAFPDRG